MSFFIKPQVIRLSAVLTKIKYIDSYIHLPNSDIFIDSTTAILIYLSENDGESVDAFYAGVKQFYQAFVKKLPENVDFKSYLFRTLRLLDPKQCQDVLLDVFDKIGDLIPISFDRAAVSRVSRICN